MQPCSRAALQPCRRAGVQPNHTGQRKTRPAELCCAVQCSAVQCSAVQRGSWLATLTGCGPWTWTGLKKSGNINRERRRSIRFRSALRTCAPCGPSARLASLTKSSKTPTPIIVPPFVLTVARECGEVCLLQLLDLCNLEVEGGDTCTQHRGCVTAHPPAESQRSLPLSLSLARSLSISLSLSLAPAHAHRCCVHMRCGPGWQLGSPRDAMPRHATHPGPFPHSGRRSRARVEAHRGRG